MTIEEAKANKAKVDALYRHHVAENIQAGVYTRSLELEELQYQAEVALIEAMADDAVGKQSEINPDFMMTRDRIGERIEQIKTVAHEPARAIRLEKRLWEDVLRAIACGWIHKSEDPFELAMDALQTKSINFPRWLS